MGACVVPRSPRFAKRATDDDRSPATTRVQLGVAIPRGVVLRSGLAWTLWQRAISLPHQPEQACSDALPRNTLGGYLSVGTDPTMLLALEITEVNPRAVTRGVRNYQPE